MQRRQTTTVTFMPLEPATVSFTPTISPRPLEKIIVEHTTGCDAHLHIATRRPILPERAGRGGFAKRKQLGDRMERVGGAILSFKAGGGFGSYAVHFDMRLLPRMKFLDQAFTIVTHLCEQLAIDKANLHPHIVQTTALYQGGAWIDLSASLAHRHGYFCPVLIQAED